MAWQNDFLDSLPEADGRRLGAALTDVSLPRNEILSEAGQAVPAVYLPIDCILSVVTVMRDGGQVESRTIGRESGYGLLHALGSPISFERMTVQVAGRAWRLPLEVLKAAADESAAIRKSIVHHAQATLVQTAQSVACNSLHSAEQRLCRWLLLTQDRVGGDVLPLTQEHMAIMLGVQRTTVTALASELQARGHISYVRGRITVHNRAALERCTCECYEAIQRGAAAMLRADQRKT
jgi:CRP-like cAMP-binding protein